MWGNTGLNHQQHERPRYLSTDQPDARSRSLLSRSRVHRAVEAARRVGGGLVVAALNVGGLSAAEQVPRRMPAASALRAEKAIAERSRGAHPCVAQLASSSSRYGTAPAILAESCLTDEGLRLGA